ncbi:hypothetical protein [Puniceicoccus vermicola]|uniref:Alginate biosynthesis protein AlgF n=1 Tax=Puniceicoccus vermicola TaxID=388746 RepID=A0A7X1B160_9BACT|nr:hypothetical protein [Puniceicoccus vermicola]MBC2603721.1 hypothetical protein [Puniceicoccus vermicola]
MAPTRTNLKRSSTRGHWKNLFLLGLIFFGNTEINAQTSPLKQPEASFRTLSLLAPINDLYYDYDDQKIPVRARTTSFSRTYPLPKKGTLDFYRLLPPKEGETEPQRVTVTEIDLDQKPGSLFVFMTESATNPNRIKTFVAQDSWESHPLETLLVFNLSERHTLVKLDTAGKVKLLGPGESATYPYPQSGAKQALLNVATQEGQNDWKLRIGGPQITLPGTRSTLVLVDEQATELRPLTEDLLIRKLIERAPVPTE